MSHQHVALRVQTPTSRREAAHTPGQSALPALLIRVTSDGPNASEVAAVLARHGGVDFLDRGSARLYAMPSESARAEALDDVRGRFGWTAAEPAS